MFAQQISKKQGNKVGMNSLVYNPTLHIFNSGDIYIGWSCVLNCFMLSSLPCFLDFADLLSLHHYIFSLV